MVGFIHPLRWYRRVKFFIQISAFKSKCKRKGIQISVGQHVSIKNVVISSNMSGKGHIILGSNCSLYNVCISFAHIEEDSVLVIGDNSIIKNCDLAFCTGGKIRIGNHCTINAQQYRKTYLGVRSGCSIAIGNDCILSDSIEILTTDWHRVFDGNGVQLNADSDISIGDHTWIGKRVTILKGVMINDNNIIGAGSIVTKSINETNSIIAGNPASVRKTGIIWER